MNQRTVEITLANRKMKVACPMGQETALLTAVAEVNKRVEQCNISQVANSTEQSALIVALNLANDLLKIQADIEQERQETRSKIDLLQSTIEQALGESNAKQA